MLNTRNGIRLAGFPLLVVLVIVSLAGATSAQDEESLSAAELEQLAAPVALYPDDLLTQILMASTYPLEVVAALRWQKANPTLEGDALASAIEQESWDPSVKSLIGFPQVLEMMDQELEWTQKLGNAVLSQQKDLMDAVQRLRAKARAEGNLETTEEQVVVVEQTVIRIEQADPTVIYVPVYNPTIVYGYWAYPSYPPYYYYPPGYGAPPRVVFATGLAVGLAWGYAWGECNWRHGDIDIDVNRNIDLNRNIDRERRSEREGGRDKWQHDPSHRKGVPYRDSGTAERFGRGGDAQAAQAREAFRGRTTGSGSLSDRAGGSRLSNGFGTGRSSLDRRSSTAGSSRSVFGGSSSRSATRASSSRGRSSLGSRGGRGGRRR